MLESGLALAPEMADLHMELGYVHLKRNKRAQARALFLQVLAAMPERHDALLALAKVMALDGEYAAAADLYRRALGLRPDDIVTRNQSRHMSAGNGRARRRRSQPARGDTRRCADGRAGRSPRSRRRRTAVSSCGQARRRNSCGSSKPLKFVLRPELPPIDAGLAIDRVGEIVRPLGFFSVNGAVRTVQFSRLTGMHCATGVPFGSTPLKFASCQWAGK